MTTSPTNLLRRVLRLPHGPDARFAALDGYRGLAAVMVVIYHVGANQWTLVQKTVAAKLVYGFGNMGVTLFFVLSGFLLFRPFAERDLAGEKPPGLRRYTTNRLLRIVPAYWFALTVALLLVPGSRLDLTGRALGTVDYLRLYLFAQNYDTAISYAGLAVAWTLGIELCFYIALPFIAMASRAVANAATSTPKGRLLVHLGTLAVLYGGAWLFRAAVVRTSRGMTDTYGLWLFNYLDWFALGMLLALLVAWRDQGGRLPRIVELAAASTSLMWVAGISLYLLYAVRLHNDFSQPETLTQIYSRFLWPGLAALCVLLPVTVGVNRADPVHRGMRTRLLLFFGTISYGLYLWHLPIIDKLKEGTWWPQQALAFAFTMPFLVVLAGTTLMATISWFCIEEPALRLKKGSRKAVAPAEPADDFSSAWFDQPADSAAAGGFERDHDDATTERPTPVLAGFATGTYEQPAHDEPAYDPRYDAPAYEQTYDNYYDQPAHEQGYDQPVYDQPGYDQPGYDQPGYEPVGYEPVGYEPAPYEQPAYEAVPATSGFDYEPPAEPADERGGRRRRRR